MRKIAFCVCLTLVLVMLLSSCGENKAISFGFNGIWIGQLPHVHFAIESDKDEFNINEIAVDLSFGNGSAADVGGYVGEDGTVECIALYLSNGKYSNTIVGYDNARYKDYTDIDGLYFVREIDIDDYNENYDVENSFWQRKYEHTEKLYIPRDMFELTEGYVCIAVAEIVYYANNNAYGFGLVGITALKYEMLGEDNMVKLSEPASSVYSDPK